MHTSILYFSCLCLTFIGSHSATAQSFQTLEATLRDHPSLQVLDHEATASRERASAAAILPDPVFSAGINNFPVFDPAFDAFLPTNKSLGVEQNFGNRAERKARTQEALARADEITDRRPQRYAALRATLIALLHDKARVESQRTLAQARDTKYDELMQVAESEIDAGRPALFRLAQIEGERAEVARTLIRLDGEAAQIDAQLIDLVGTIPNTPPPPVTPAPWNGNASEFHATRVATAAVAVRERAIDAARASLNPKWGAQLTYQQRESGLDFAGDDWVSMSLSVSVPVWARRAKTPRVRAATAERVAAQANFRAAERSAVAQYTRLQTMRETARANMMVLQQKITAMEDQVGAALTVYETGAGDYSRILDGQLAILVLRENIATETAHMAKATAHMNALLVNP